ncbi:MAG: hypothetical protein IJ597_00995 [Synergistaceae bacterium]|nr:hypothetical protein [Synergistaceae bacterium]
MKKGEQIMKKFFTVIFLLLILSSVSFAASSEDVRENLYVRQDIFEIEMKNIHSTLEKILNKLDAQEKSINALANAVAVSSARIDGIEKRMDTMNTFLYYLLVLLAALIVLPYVIKWLEGREIKKQLSITLEDIKRLIAEAKLSGVSQV